MTLQNIAKDLGQIYQRLFDHSPAVQGEVGYFCSQFEEGPRNKEFDQLLQTSHMLNEAVETEIEERIKGSPMDKITTKLEAVAGMLERTVSRGQKGRYQDYIETARKQHGEDLTEFKADLEKKRTEVDSQCSEKLKELEEQFNNLQKRSTNQNTS